MPRESLDESTLADGLGEAFTSRARRDFLIAGLPDCGTS